MRILLEDNEPWLKSGDTLVCFGDSLTHAHNPGYVEILQEKLGAKGITVINAGVGGDKTPAALTRLQSDVIDRKPTAVSIFLGANDGVIGRGVWADEPVVSPITYKENLIWMVHLCRLLGGIQKFSIAAHPTTGEGTSLMQFGLVYQNYALAAHEAADTAGALCVPLDAVFYKERLKHLNDFDENGLLFTRDGTHMTAQGYAMVADTMLKTWHLN